MRQARMTWTSQILVIVFFERNLFFQRSNRKVLLHDLSTIRILGLVTPVSQWGRADARVVWRDDLLARRAIPQPLAVWWFHHGLGSLGKKIMAASLMKSHQPNRLATICDMCERKHGLPWASNMCRRFAYGFKTSSFPWIAHEVTGSLDPRKSKAIFKMHAT